MMKKFVFLLLTIVVIISNSLFAQNRPKRVIILGFDGMPRRYYDYPPQYATLHLVSTIGAYLNGFGYFTSLAFLLYTHLFGKVKAPRNPYNSVSLEWQTQSPPVHENFDETPVVTTDPYNYGKHVGSHA